MRSRSVRGAVFLAVGTGAEFVLRILSTSLLARLLVPEHFGLLGMATAVTGIAGQFSQLGLSTVTVQRRDIDDHQVSNLFWINVAIGAVLFGVCCVAAPLVARFYGDSRLVPIMMAVSSAFLWSGLAVQHEALLARQMHQARSTFVRLAATVLSVALAVFLALRGFGYWALVWQEVSRSLLAAAGVWLVCPWRPGLPNRSADIRGLLRFGTDLTLTQIGHAIVSNADRLVVGRLFGAAALGTFRQAQQLIMVPLEQLNAPIASISQPGLSVLQDEPERYRRYYTKTVFLVGLLTMPIAAFGAVYADGLVRVVLGAQWADAVPYFTIFALAAFVRPVLGTATTVLITRGHSRRLLRMTFVTQVTMLVFIAVGTRWGAIGVAMAQLVTALVLFVPNLGYSFVSTPITIGVFFRAILPPVIASVTMAFGLVGLRLVTAGLTVTASLSLGAVVGAALYVALCFVQRGCWREIQTLLGDVAGMARRPLSSVA